MSDRGLTTAELDAAAAPAAIVVPLFELLFDSGTLRLALGSVNVTYAGVTWYATGAALGVSESNESADSTEGLSLELTGLDVGIVALAANEPYRGRTLRVLEAWLGENLQPLFAPRVEWLGRLVAMSIEEQAGKVTVSVQAEHYEAELARQRVLRYTSADQRRRYPGDAGCDLLESMVDAQIVWPNKEIQKRRVPYA